MGFATDLKLLYHMLLRPIRGKDHAARLESFYAGQAEGYDDFRRRLLKGREEMYTALDLPSGGVWVDPEGGLYAYSTAHYRAPDTHQTPFAEFAPR